MSDRETPDPGFPTRASVGRCGVEDPEADSRGLVLVDLLRLPKTFSWRRYRTDLGGLVVALAFVAALMLLLVAIARA